MTVATTWHGRRGPVILGPTEHRVARYLADLTRAGLVTLRMTDLVAATHVERSEGYRITRRLRTLGLFGIQDDRGGSRGGRKIWRTAIEHDASQLDARRHREAWARVVAWARSRSRRISERLEAIRHHTSAMPEPARSTSRPRSPGGMAPRATVNHGAGPLPPPSGSATFLERLVAGGLDGRLAAAFRGKVQ